MGQGAGVVRQGSLVNQHLPKASVTTLVAEAFIRSANQAPAKAACDLLGLDAPSVGQDYYGGRAIDTLMRFAETGDAQLQRAAFGAVLRLAEERMGASWGPIGWAEPISLAHLRFLEAKPAQGVRGPAPRPGRRRAREAAPLGRPSGPAPRSRR
jgi:hypothetical protein